MKTDRISRIAGSLPSSSTQLVILIILLIPAIILGISYETDTALQESTQEKLVMLANTTAAHINGDEFDAIRPGEENSIEFLTVRDFLYQTLISDPRIFSIYTMRKNGSALEFVVDAEYGLSPDTPPVGEVYDYQAVYQKEDPEIILAFSGPIADTEFTTDHWGTVLSGFAPIVNSHGTVVGIVGVDVIVTSVISEQNKLKTFFFFIGLCVLILLLAGIITIERRRERADRVIRENEERFKAIFSMVPDPIIITRACDGTILMYNTALEMVAGVSGSEYIGKKIQDMKIWSSDRERTLFLEALGGKNSEKGEYTWIRPDGESRNILYSFRKLKFQDEDVILHVGWDITDIRRAEQALRDSEEMFRNPVEHSPVGVFLYQDDGFRYVNPRLAMLFGYESEEIRAMPFDALVVPEERQTVRNILVCIGQKGESETAFEFRGLRKDGSVFFLEAYTSLLTYQSQPAVYGTIIDCTSRKESEQQLVQSEMQYRLIADNMKDVIWILIPETFRFRYLSPSIRNLLGYSAEEFMSRPFDGELLSDTGKSLHDTMVSYIDQYIRSGTREFFNLEVRLTDKAGIPVIIEILANCFTNHDTGDVEVLGICRDITERKGYEERIEHQNLELSAAYEEAHASYQDMCAMEAERTYAYKVLKKEQEELKNTQKILQKAQNLAMMGNYEVKLPAGQVYVSEEFRHILDIDPDLPIPDIESVAGQVMTGESEDLQDLIRALWQEGTPFTAIFWVQPRKGSKRAVRFQGEIESENDTVHTISLIVQDITEQKIMEDQITEAYKEKEILLREIHHRVKNNMQIISSLLSLQSRTITDPSIQELFQETQGRVQSLSLVHELLYQSDNLNKINYRTYLQKITSYLMSSDRASQDRIRCTITSEDLELSIEKAIPCSLIITEMITNSLKYAFDGRKSGEITITFSFLQDSNMFLLEYRDNGKGMPPGFDPKKSTGFGSSLISGLTQQISGTIEIGDESPGVHYIITFPPDE